MKPAHLLMTLLVVANVLLLDIAVQQCDNVIEVVLGFPAGLSMAHVGLLAIWLGLGRTKLPLRLIAVSVGMLLLHVVVVNWQSWLNDLPAAVAFGVVLVSIPFLVMRTMGLRLTRLGDSESASGPTGGQADYQFSLRAMFAWTTAAAVLLSTIGTISGFQEAAEDVVDVDRFQLDMVAIVFIPTLLALWAVLGMKTFKRRIFLFVSIPPLASLLYLLALGGNNTMAIWTRILLPQNGVLLLSLAVCRVAGYRIAWRGRRVRRDAP